MVQVVAMPLDRACIENNSIPVTESGCWIWLKSTTKQGYGDLQRKHHGGHLIAHRASYELYKGSIPDGLHVMHKCDVRCCVNPDHLELGTNYENILDSMNKGRRKGITRRRPSGLSYRPPTEEMKDSKRKIKNSMLPQVMQLRAQGLSLEKIGWHFEVDGVTILNALRRIKAKEGMN